MSFRLSIAWRGLPLVLVSALSACGPSRNEFAPPCPTASVISPTGDLALYNPNSSGRDITDLVVQGRITGIKGRCQAGNKGYLDAGVAIGFEFARGPALQGDRVTVPVFLAVTEGERILDKKVFAVEPVFPPNTDRFTVTSGEVDMALPVSSTKTGAAYTIVAGFQLTPDELTANRARAR